MKGSNKSTSQVLPKLTQTDISGMMCRMDADKIPDNKSPFLLNVELGKETNISKRNGSQLIGTNQESASFVQGGIDFVRYDGTRDLRVVVNGNIKKYNPATSGWSNVATSVFNTSSKVQMVLFNNKVYYISPNDNMVSEDSMGNITTIGSGGNEIKGQNLTVAENALFISNINSIANSTVTQGDRCYFSFTSTNTPSDQLWTNTTGQNTLATSTRFFTALSPIVASFSLGVSGISYHFTDSATYAFDLRFLNNLIGPQKVADFGICGPRAVTMCNGFLLWMDSNARIWAYGGVGLPVPLSYYIEDDFYGNSLISKIDKTQLSNVCAGSFNNTFYFSIGNVTYFNETVNGCIIKGLLPPHFGMMLDPSVVKWSIDNYPEQPAFFINAKINKIPMVLFGSNSTQNLYQMNLGGSYADNNQAINMKIKTKFYSFGDFFISNKSSDIFIKYKPQTTPNTYLKTKFSTDMNLNYTTISDPLANQTATNGVINMYDANSTTTTDAVQTLTMPSMQRFRTLSLEFSNNVINQGTEISSIATRFTQQELDILPKSS